MPSLNGPALHGRREGTIVPRHIHTWTPEAQQDLRTRCCAPPFAPYLLQGLLVNVGLQTGTPTSRFDGVSGRMDYFGNVMNSTARMMAKATHGVTVVPCPTLEAVQAAPGPAWKHLAPTVAVVPLGAWEFKGVASAVDMVAVMPSAQRKRALLCKAGGR